MTQPVAHTYEELIEKARSFMVATRGRPDSLDPEARERWYQDLGLIVHFLARAFAFVEHP